MKKLSVLVLLSCVHASFASERPRPAFDPSKGQSSVPGGSAIAICAEEAMQAQMQRMQRSPQLKMDEIVSSEGYQEARALFLVQQKEAQEKLNMLAGQAKGNADLLEQIKKAQEATASNIQSVSGRLDKMEPRVISLETQIKDLLSKSHTQSPFPLVAYSKHTMNLLKLHKTAEANSVNKLSKQYNPILFSYIELVKDWDDKVVSNLAKQIAGRLHETNPTVKNCQEELYGLAEHTTHLLKQLTIAYAHSLNTRKAAVKSISLFESITTHHDAREWDTKTDNLAEQIVNNIVTISSGI